MANKAQNVTGYVCVGVADNDTDAEKIKQIHGIEPKIYKSFKITGIDHEAIKLHSSLDKFYQWIIQKIDSQPIDDKVKNDIGRNMKIVNYFNKSVMIFSLKSGNKPVTYDSKFYERIGANTIEIKVDNYSELFKRFS